METDRSLHSIFMRKLQLKNGMSISDFRMEWWGFGNRNRRQADKKERVWANLWDSWGKRRKESRSTRSSAIINPSVKGTAAHYINNTTRSLNYIWFTLITIYKSNLNHFLVPFHKKVYYWSVYFCSSIHINLPLWGLTVAFLVEVDGPNFLNQFECNSSSYTILIEITMLTIQSFKRLPN